MTIREREKSPRVVVTEIGHGPLFSVRKEYWDEDIEEWTEASDSYRMTYSIWDVFKWVKEFLGA